MREEDFEKAYISYEHRYIKRSPGLKPGDIVLNDDDVNKVSHLIISIMRELRINSTEDIAICKFHIIEECFPCTSVEGKTTWDFGLVLVAKRNKKVSKRSTPKSGQIFSVYSQRLPVSLERLIANGELDYYKNAGLIEQLKKLEQPE